MTQGRTHGNVLTYKGKRLSCKRSHIIHHSEPEARYKTHTGFTGGMTMRQRSDLLFTVSILIIGICLFAAIFLWGTVSAQPMPPEGWESARLYKLDRLQQERTDSYINMGSCLERKTINGGC